MLKEFSPAGRARCYELVATLLEAWPETKGLIGSSWYYDPRVGQITPHLAYLHDEPVARGAIMLKQGREDSRSGALKRSRTRRELYEAGQYVPTTYMMIWLRDDILAHHAQAVAKV
jgi:hypothetical protein